MQAIVKNAIVTVPIVGNGGYANNSGLSIRVEGVGLVDLPDPWDLSALKGSTITEWNLGIPSGVLEAKYGISAEWSEDKYEEGIVILHAEEAVWGGKQAGFFGGMSGYGSFSGDIVAVTEGTYLLPEDVPGMRRTSIPLDFSIREDGPPRPSHHRVDWPVYCRRHQRHKDALGYNAAHQDAAEAARILQIPMGDRSPEESAYIDGWWKQIRAIDALTDEEFMAQVISQRLKDAEPQPAPDLPDDLIRILWDAYPALGNTYIKLQSDWALRCCDRDDHNRKIWVVAGDDMAPAVIEDEAISAALDEWEQGRRRKLRVGAGIEDGDYEDYDGEDSLLEQ